MNWLLVFAFLFFMGCVIGWGIELFYRRFISKNNPERKWINPGFLMGPYLPLYGFGLWGMYFISDLAKVNMTGSQAINSIIILVIMTIVMTLIEYIAGLIFIKGLKVRLWDYSEEKFNLQGIICLKFSLAWGVLGCFYFFVIDPYVIDGIYWLSQHLTFSFFIGAFFGVFTIDVVYSLNLVARFKKFAEEQEIEIKYEELKQEFARRRDELEEKRHFILSFRTEYSPRAILEEYAQKQRKIIEDGRAQFEEFVETVEELKNKF